MIRNMVFMTLRGLLSDRPLIIETLHDAGVLHFQEEPGETVSEESAAELKILRGKALGLLEALEWQEWGDITSRNLQEKRTALSSPDRTITDGIRESLDSFSVRLNELKMARSELEGRMNSIRGTLKTLEHFRSFISDNIDKGNSMSIWWTQRANVAEIVSSVQKRIRNRDPLGFNDSVTYHTAVAAGGESVAAIGVHPDNIEDVRVVMGHYDCLPWQFPADFEGLRYDEAIRQMEIVMKDFPRRIQETENTLQKTRNLWGPRIGALYVLLDEKVQEIFVEKGSETTGEMFTLEGWVPLDEKGQLTMALREKFDGRILLSWKEPSPDDWAMVPTSLKNPGWFKPFEIFLALMPVISYRGLDPTIVIGIFFPFFSGCMIGDAGYGAVIFFLALWLRKMRSRPIAIDIGSILLFISSWSIAWGFAYGEFFGDLGHRLFHLEPLWLERSQVVIPVMVFTVSLGFAHVLLGFVLGVIQGIKTGQKHLWIERLGNIFILVALLSAMIVVKGWLPGKMFSLTVSFLVLGLTLLLAGGGIGGLVESLGSIGNILSYVRIAAIGLSSAILAMVATSFVDSMGVSFVGVFLALTIHLLNFVLAVAGSGLHSARLQYVEFLGKFYTGGGTRYKPFSRRKPELWKKR
jgi:V/A-type H+-transporting ATPase subunit I